MSIARLQPARALAAFSRVIAGRNFTYSRTARKSAAFFQTPAAIPARPAAPNAVVSTILAEGVRARAGVLQELRATLDQYHQDRLRQIDALAGQR